MNKKIITIVLCMLVFFSFTAVSEKLSQNNMKNISETGILSDDVPVWGMGNNWKYNIQVEGEFGDSLSYSWVFENTVFTVESETSSEYYLSISGDVTGDMTISQIQIVRGSLKETTITGSCKVQKSNIGLKEINANIQGKLSVANIPLKSFTMNVDVSISPAYCSVSFPINVGKKWAIPVSDVSGTVSLSLLDNPIYIDDIVGGDNAECTGTQTKTVQAGTYDSYKIISDGDVEEWYYASDAGNVIKAFGDISNNIDVSLLSTNFGSSTPGAPNKPSKPSGTSSISPGTEYTYSSVTTDPESDQIFYLFSWGDGSDSGWLGPYSSGDTGEASHSWSSKGTYSVKVKAKDTEGHESSWSDPLSVKTPKIKVMDRILFLNFFKNIFPNLF